MPIEQIPRYECDECGACCRHLIIEIEHLDVVREPRLLPVVKLLVGDGAVRQKDGTIKYEDEWDKVYRLTPPDPCPMLGHDNRCTCYPSRPNVCVAMEAGDEQCQMSRKWDGLPPLEPIRP